MQIFGLLESLEY